MIGLYRQHRDFFQVVGFAFLLGVSFSGRWVTAEKFDALAAKFDAVATAQAQTNATVAVRLADHDRQLAAE